MEQQKTLSTSRLTPAQRHCLTPTLNQWAESLPLIEQEKRQLEGFLFEHVYRHPRLVEVRQGAAMRLRQLYRLLVSNPERLPTRVRGWVLDWGIERATGADRFCDEQYLLLVEMGRPCGVDWS